MSDSELSRRAFMTAVGASSGYASALADNILSGEPQPQPTNIKGLPPLPDGVVTRLAFGSCAKQWQHQKIWAAVESTQPDLFLFLGDAIYADTGGVTAWDVSEKQLRGEWNRLADKPEFLQARAKIPMLATWDNHDYGSHDRGADFELKEVSRNVFLDFFNVPADSDQRKRDGIYAAYTFGPEGQRLQIILLDTKSFRGTFRRDVRSKAERLAVGKVGGYLPHVDHSQTLLGAEQWRWLGDQLEQPAELRIICSSTQVIPNQKGMDEWGCFPHERSRLLKLIEVAGASQVLILSGNVHFAEISGLPCSSGLITEFTSSGLTHVNTEYANAENKFRRGSACAELNFGCVEIDWAMNSGPGIRLRAIGVTGEAALDVSWPVN